MEKEFIPYQESLELKELGFDEPCFVYWVYDGVEITYSTSHNRSGWSMIGFKNSQMLKKMGLCTTPTFSQVFRWFRKKHDLVHRIDKEGGWWVCAILDLYDEKEQGTIEIYLEDCYPKSYEEAELECLKKLIEIVKK